MKPVLATNLSPKINELAVTKLKKGAEKTKYLHFCLSLVFSLKNKDKSSAQVPSAVVSHLSLLL